MQCLSTWIKLESMSSAIAVRLVQKRVRLLRWYAHAYIDSHKNNLDCYLCKSCSLSNLSSSVYYVTLSI